MNVSTLAKINVSIFLVTFLSGCQLPYLVSGAVEQVRILNSRQKIDKVIQNVATTPEIKEKLLYSQEALNFGTSIGLDCKGNFQSYVQLNRPFVSYLVIASEKNRLEAKTWWFPIVGSFPYKGFFSETQALTAAQNLEKKGYDTYTRGVPAYSSLGWFKEPILSSMLQYSKEYLAETIFHECFHRTFFLKNQVDLNEQLATFFGHHILLLFLKNTKNTILLSRAQFSWEDDFLFSEFLKETLEETNGFYKSKPIDRTVLFEKIKSNYIKNLKPHLKENSYDSVFLNGLNNAKLVAFKTYFHDFKTMDRILNENFQGDILQFLNSLKETPKKDSLKLLKGGF